MFRSSRAVALPRWYHHSLTKPIAQGAGCLTKSRGFKASSVPVSRSKKPTNVAVTTFKPFSTSIQRYAGPFDHVDKKHEDVVEHEKLEAHPDQVSTTSSVHQIFHEQGVEDKEKDEDMLAGVWSDWVGHCCHCSIH